MLPGAVKKTAEKLLSDHYKETVQIKSFRPVSGGCINEGGKAETNLGDFFIKWNNASRYPQMFEAEAKGLDLLRSPDVIGVPEPILTGKAEDLSFVIMTMLNSAQRSKNYWEKFGVSLANLHKTTNDYYGLDHDNYIGSLPQSNTQQQSWVDFFIEQRMDKQVSMARDDGLISRSHIKQFEKLYVKLNEIFPEEKPALLHGDLWSGNFITGPDGQAWLIDPAVYFGHREMDISMTALFGGFNNEFYTSYNETYPLEKGFEERKDICNLYPLMVHVNLFGSSYLHSVETTLRKF